MSGFPKCAASTLSALLLSGIAAVGAAGARPPNGPPPSAPPVVTEETLALPPGLPEGWYAWIETSMGVIVARLLPEQAPQSVAHFAALAEGRLAWPDPVTGTPRKDPYYDGLKVTRAVAAERIEIGGSTVAGRSMPPIFVPPEGEGPVNFTGPGRLGMVRTVLNRISGVKFFVTAGTIPYLNGSHPCFGIVVSGLDVVERASAVKTFGNEMPIDPVMVKRIRVCKVGNPAPLPEPMPYTPKAQKYGLRPEPR